MTIAVSQSLPTSKRTSTRFSLRHVLPLLVATTVSTTGLAGTVQAAEPMEARIEALIPQLEPFIEKGMKDFDNPGLAIGIVTGDKLVYAKGFGVRKKGGEPVDTSTVFQIGSTTKAFLATTMAIAVDQKKFAWDDRVVDLYPEFQMKDPWVTHEFRVFDLLAQRSGMPPYANDSVGMLGFDQPAMIHSLRYVEPVSSFRSTFAYTNITHMLAQRIVAKVMGAADWDSVVQSEIFTPLGMKDSSFTAEAIEAAANHTVGHRWTPEGTVEVPFTPIFPYGFGGAGAINSTIEDMQHWLRLHLANGEFEGKRIVSAANLDITRVSRIGITDQATYAMGWLLESTANGMIIWHNGGTSSYGAFVGFLPDKDVGIVVLTNETNMGFPDAVGLWTLDRLMDNPVVDYVAAKLTAAKAGAASSKKMFDKPASPRPTPPLGPLAGDFTSPTFGKAKVAADGDGLLVTIETTGAKIKLAPWDGGILTATLLAEGPLAAMAANLGPDPLGFAEFQMDKAGQLNILKLSMSDGQAYLLTRE